MKIALILIAIALLAWLAWTIVSVKGIEEPAYTVLEKKSGYEVREYAPYIVAQVTVTGSQDEALNQGFRYLAGYIFWGNTKKQSIAMTAPVSDITPASQSIQMTVPVIDIQKSQNTHVIQFTMPKEFTLDTLPKPNDNKVTFAQVPKAKKAVLRYSWWATEERVSAKKEELQKLLDADKLKTVGDMISAQYNPPWSIPFMRRNEIIVEVQ